MEYQSDVVIEARSWQGVRFRIARMSFGRRVELTRRVAELAGKVGYLQAGDEAKEKLDAAVLNGEIDRVYLEWGLRGIEGLMIDGAPATPESLMLAGPEELCREVVAAIKAQCGLNEEERKN